MKLVLEKIVMSEIEILKSVCTSKFDNDFKKLYVENKVLNVNWI